MTYEVNRARSIIDAHSHLDQYDGTVRKMIIDYLESPTSELTDVISISMNLPSSIHNLKLSESHKGIHSAFGFHPEQNAPSESELQELISFMELNKNKMVAIGEVGLPYYLKESNIDLPLEPYIEALEVFIRKASDWNKPIVLHSIYEDAVTTCDFLERHSVKKAHFHWFKGSVSTLERMIENGYFISVTPDCVYEQEIQSLIELYPIEQMMIETDGPWPFTGPFENQVTHPKMMHQSIATIAYIKKMDLNDVYEQIYGNTKTFYNL
ncbi:TatD family hydrolase [Sporosarcina siberiensis]|uniref:TatD family hydrolase n=1 Tax=Sporosarcina siberiensis TaxID=1365606 RepID=A0ABW4SGS2_9BACL